MGSQVKAKPQTYSTGLYGSATTNKYGTTYNPSDFEKKLIGMTNDYIPQYLEQMVNPTYDSEIFKAQTTQRNRLANQSFENNLINPLASRGLTRGSSLNQMSNQFANKLADLETDAMANEDTRNANILNNLLTYYQIPYNMMGGITNYSQQQYQQALRNAASQGASGLGNFAGTLGGMGALALKAASANNGAGTSGVNSQGMNWGSLLGGLGGLAFGGGAGGQLGAVVGGQLGGMWK